MRPLALCSTATDYTAADRAYIDAHRFIYGELGEHIATAALLIRDTLMRPSFVLPVVRIAPVAPWGNKRGLSGNGCSLAHVERHGLENGIWLYLHRKFWDDGRFRDDVDEVVLHELLHNELKQLDEPPQHKGAPWARRCQELSDRLGIKVRIERVRSVRRNGKISPGTPDGCLSYEELARWPASLLKAGPPLRARLTAEAALCSVAVDYKTGGQA